MSWNTNQPPQALPFPTDYVVQGSWINNPMGNPPQCPLPAPGAAEGIERNILGALLEYLQSQSNVSPVRCFTYNLLSYTEYNNQDFTALLNTVLILTGALLESGQFQRGSQAAEFAVARMVDYQYVQIAKKFTPLQDMDPELGNIAGQIEQIGGELGQMIKGYTQQLQQQQQQPQTQWGSGQRAPSSNDRFGGQRQAPQYNPWGSKPQQKQQPQQINTDIFSSVKPRQTPPEPPVRSSPPMTNTLLDLYGVTAPADTPPAPTQRGRAPAPVAPKTTGHPTGNTVHVQETPNKEARWVVNSDKTKPVYMKPTASTKGRQNLLYDRTTHKPAYRIEGNLVQASITERETPMSAGYELHELTFRNKNDGLFATEIRKPVGEVYNRDRLLKATDEEVGDLIPYYQESHSGGKLDDTALFSLAAMHDSIDEENAVLVLSYKESQTIMTNVNLKVELDTLRDTHDMASIRDRITAIKKINVYLGAWLMDSMTGMVNKILKEDYALDDTIDSFEEDASDFYQLVGGDVTQELVESLEDRIRTRLDVLIGNVGYLEGSKDEWGMCTLTHTHLILDLPMTVEQLELSGNEAIGRVTRTTAPVLHRLIEGAVGENADHYYWLRTLDGTIVEAVPAPGGSSDWILAVRDHLGQ